VTLNVEAAPPVSLSINDQSGTVSSDYGYGGYYGGYYGAGYYMGGTYDTQLVFTVSLSGPSTSSVTVNYATANGSATAGNDYASTSGTLNFAAGETSKTLTVAIYGEIPSTRTFYVRLSNPVNATIADGEGSGTIEPTYYGSSYRGYRSRYGYVGGAGYVTIGGYGYGGFYGYYRTGGALGICSIGYFWNGYTCVPSGTGSTICPAGLVWNGSQCVSGSGNSSLCPVGYYWNGFGCVVNPFAPPSQAGSLTISDASCLGGTPCIFNVTHSGGVSTATVNYSTSNLSGIGGGACLLPPSTNVDFIAVTNGSVSVAPNSTTQIMIITCPNPNTELTTDFFNVNITSGTRITRSQGLGRIDFIPPPIPIED
jgi:hypothetical protein